MPEDIDNLEEQPSPREMSDEQFDALLTGALWPQMSPATLERIATAVLPSAKAGRRGGAAWWIGSLAAAAVLAVTAMLWALWPDERPRTVTARQPAVEEVEPSRQPEAPQFHYAVLPGREPTTAERAWAQAIRREQALRAKEPPQEQSRPPEQQGAPPLSEKVRSGPTVPVTPAAIAQRPRPDHLLATLLDRTAGAARRQEAARALPASAIEQALTNPALASRAPELAAALTICQDPAAASVLVRLAERKPELALQAVAAAPAGSPGTLGLVVCLDDPLVSRRERAASLLAASSDPAVLEALSRRLSAPAARREVLIALLSNEAAEARAIVAQAETNPELRAIVQSLRLQGYGPPRQISQLQMTIL